jgi:HEAT repeat protein
MVGRENTMNSRADFDQLVRLAGQGIITPTYLEHSLLTHLHAFPQQRDAVLAALTANPNKAVQEVAPRIRTFLHNKDLSEDFDHIRRTSPLQPGTRLTLFGGYDYYSTSGRPRWLNGREFYKATFLYFAQSWPNSVPVACVELDEEYESAEHRGRYALLSSTYSSASVVWAGEGTVCVRIAAALPEDVPAFFAAHPYEKAVETHAQYQINPPLATIAQEVARALDDLHAQADELAAGYAAQRVQRLLADAPALHAAVIPALIHKLPRGTGSSVAVRGLLRGLGPPALRALIDELSSADAWRRGEAARVLGTFGPEARAALPALENLLRDEDLEARVPAAIAIWRIDGRTPEMARIVLEGLQTYGLDEEAAACLREMGPDAGDVVPALVEILRDGKVPLWRAPAAVALGGMGLDAMPAVPILVEAMEDVNRDVRGSALAALRELRALARTGELILAEWAGNTPQASGS